MCSRRSGKCCSTPACCARSSPSRARLQRLTRSAHRTPTRTCTRKHKRTLTREQTRASLCTHTRTFSSGARTTGVARRCGVKPHFGSYRMRSLARTAAYCEWPYTKPPQVAPRGIGRAPSADVLAAAETCGTAAGGRAAPAIISESIETVPCTDCGQRSHGQTVVLISSKHSYEGCRGTAGRCCSSLGSRSRTCAPRQRAAGRSLRPTASCRRSPRWCARE